MVNHLKKLELNGIVQNFLQRKEGTNDYSFYEITKYGEKIIRDLISSYNEFHTNMDQWQVKIWDAEIKRQSPNDMEKKGVGPSQTTHSNP